MGSIWGMSTTSDVILVNHESPEWERMWEGLHDEFGDYKCPQTLEFWQYMGTYNTSEGWVHQFRHRSYYDKRTTVNRTPSPEFMANLPQILSGEDK
jgi:hypothetical protein